jgi:GAF domain-containing protein
MNRTDTTELLTTLAGELADELKGLDFAGACEHVVRRLRGAVPHYNWVGIYLLEGDELVLAAWDGPEATEHVRIPIGQGICGLAAREKRTVIVDDVNADSRYLACFPHTRSEIVVPLFAHGGEVLGEIDIDSDTTAAFTGADEVSLTEVARQLADVYARAQA